MSGPVHDQGLPAGSEGWGGFTADPRDPATAGLRAGNADRAHASAILGRALAEGRLTEDEHASRLASVQATKELGQFVPLVSDVMIRSVPAPQEQAVQRRSRVRAGALRGWAALSALLIAIWVVTSVTAGELLYFWPIWPMLGMAVPMIFAVSARGSGGEGRTRSERRETRGVERLERREQRAIGSGEHGDLSSGQAAQPTEQQPQEYPLYRPDDLR
ncbi:DUF1707 SHOCT-like domain-containing protein [Propionicicella superfundia]|uniref:DUF1707 SHOCT-like domain-containing protein n=1 Tax=Propionicicella superfundia TaxID=348582 RepID=UPI00041765F1|nr:DUF1707 domain-containing protein [Propionicicella superfundia]